ncbi:Fur family transcriptional regulator [Brevundimonas sp.]|uniref:Fur family transcriptional regulator n=1 Tax=Brevundimonas sp. TaxID=1871086 RepID=UPI001DC40DFA|nr:Fur family transcriptional regulator [Brevundimonas sp.]MBA3999558.1 Fur family transcriptional regulator [Brevundimonas sp.]
MGEACAHHRHDTGLGPADVNAALGDAEARCVRRGERMTGPRRRVLELLLASGEPVKAYDLIAAYGADGQAAKPPTVYRALEFLERLGLAHRIASISAYVACSHGERAHAAAFLICDCCGAAVEVSPPAAAGLSGPAEQNGYVLERVTIEGHGRCADCRAD